MTDGFKPRPGIAARICLVYGLDPLLEDLRHDLIHSAALWDVPARRAVPRALVKLALYPRVRAVAYFRLSQALWQSRWGRPLALLVQAHTLKMSGAELHPAADIAPGLSLAHSHGVVIGAKAVIGIGARIYQGVTIGDDARRDGQPVIGDRAILAAGAKVLGPVTLGDDVVVAANAVVLIDAPNGAVLRGVPAVATRRASPEHA